MPVQQRLSRRVPRSKQIRRAGREEQGVNRDPNFKQFVLRFGAGKISLFSKTKRRYSSLCLLQRSKPLCGVEDMPLQTLRRPRTRHAERRGMPCRLKRRYCRKDMSLIQARYFLLICRTSAVESVCLECTNCMAASLRRFCYGGVRANVKDVLSWRSRGMGYCKSRPKRKVFSNNFECCFEF